MNSRQHPFCRTSSQALFSLSVLSLAWVGCTEPPVQVPPPRPAEKAAPVDSLYATVSQATVEGEATKALVPPGEAEVRVLAALDFEDSTLGLLKAFSDDKGVQGKLAAASGIRADGATSNKALRIAGGFKGASSYRSQPIPVEGKAVYTLSWSERTEGLEGPTGVRYRVGTVEPLFYTIPSYHHDANAFLSDAQKRKRNQVGTPITSRGPAKSGTTPWATHTLSFSPPGQANYMVLSFDHSRTKEDKGLSSASKGEVWYDNIRLEAKDSPLFVRYKNPDDLNATPSPLQLRVELPAEDKGAETRAALFAPAPSTLKFKRKIPRDGYLSLAAGILREGWIPGQGGVKFAVRVVDSQGRVSVLREQTLWPGQKEKDREWNPMVLNLGAFAGQDVSLELVTSPVRSKAGELPGMAAVWGDPVLFSRSGKGRLVVLTVIDTLNVSRLSAYGAERRTSPFLERLGKMGVQFEKAYTPAPWTLPSFASMFTGIDAARHGAGERAWGEVVWRRPLPERFVTLAERLRAAGFQTAAFMNNPYLTSAFGLGQGFTTYRDYGVGTKTGAAEVGVDRALRWLKDQRGYDRFLVLHLMDTHGPYRPPKSFAGKFSAWFYSGPFDGGMKAQEYLDLAEGKLKADKESIRRQVKDLYDGAILYTDGQVRRFYEEVKAVAGTDDVTFIVTSDHGEELFEHGGFEHGHQAYQEMLRVPLIMENPARIKGGQKVTAEVRLTDLVPTLLGLYDQPIPPGLNALSLTGVLKGEKAPWAGKRAIFAENELYGSAQAALVQGDDKYLYNMTNTSRVERRPRSVQRHELYDLKQDPGEKQNRARQAPALLQGMHAQLDDHLKVSLAGRYVLALDGGGAPHTFSGELRLPAKATWFNYYEDLIAPLADGRDGSLKVTIQGSRLLFQVHSSRALLAFKPSAPLPGEGGIELSLSVDGQVWTGGVSLGGGGAAGQGESTLKLADAQLTMAPEALPGALTGSISLFVAKTTERQANSGPQKALPGETVERLRSLGYIE